MKKSTAENGFAKWIKSEENLRLCRACKTAHYHDVATGKNVPEMDTPKIRDRFTPEAVCAKWRRA